LRSARESLVQTPATGGRELGEVQEGIGRKSLTVTTLLDLVSKLGNNGDDFGPLNERLDQIGGQLKNQESYLDALLGQNPELEDLCALELEQYSASLSVYESCLDRLEVSLTHAQYDVSLEEAECAVQLEYELGLHWDQLVQAIETIGEATPFRAINDIIKLADEVLRDDVPANFLGMACRQQERELQLVISTAAEHLVGSYQALHELLKNLADEVDLVGAEANISAAVGRIVEAANTLGSAQRQEQLVRIAAEPTRIASLNLLFHFLNELENGQAYLEDLVGPFQSFYQAVPSLLDTAVGVADGAQGTLLEETQRLIANLQDIESSVLDLEDVVFGDDEEIELRPFKEQLLELADEFADIFKAVEQLSELEGKVPCVSCSYYNPADRKQCQECGAILPAVARERVAQLEVVAQQSGVVESGAEPRFVMTENFRRLFQAIDRVIEGADASKELLRETKRMIVSVSKLQKFDFSSLASDDKAGLVERYRPSLDNFANALAEAKSACLEENLALLESSRGRLWEEAILLQEFQGALSGR
jgi:hypothetical protein